MSTVNCPNCKTALTVGPELAGQTVSCPQCGANFALPSQAGVVSVTPQTPKVRVKSSRTAVQYRRVSTSLTDVFTDFQFHRFVTPLIIRIIYCVYIAFVVAVWLLFTYLVFFGYLNPYFEQDARQAESESITPYLVVWCVGSVAYAVFAGLNILLLRLGLESVIVLFRIQEHLEDIADRTP